MLVAWQCEHNDLLFFSFCFFLTQRTKKDYGWEWVSVGNGQSENFLNHNLLFLNSY